MGPQAQLKRLRRGLEGGRGRGLRVGPSLGSECKACRTRPSTPGREGANGRRVLARGVFPPSCARDPPSRMPDNPPARASPPGRALHISSSVAEALPHFLPLAISNSARQMRGAFWATYMVSATREKPSRRAREVKAFGAFRVGVGEVGKGVGVGGEGAVGSGFSALAQGLGLRV